MLIVDWIILSIVLLGITLLALKTKKFTSSVADFLAANRCAGRYILCIGGGASSYGAISFVAMCEMYYTTGFSAYWWGMILLPAMMLTNLTGWVAYRFRQTRAMTLAQFFEIRYNDKFRIFSGIICFISGVLNFGIFPAVSAYFLVYFCGLPASIQLIGINVPSILPLMLILNGLAFFYIFLGGQITIITIDFIQGALCNIIFLIIGLFLIVKFPWSQITEALAAVPQEQSLMHPFHTGQVKDFNMWYFIILAFGYFYNAMGWQGSQGFNCSAKSAHEQKMATMLSTWRNITVTLGTILMAICAYVVMNHPAYATVSQQVGAAISTIDNSNVKTQMVTPAVLLQILPHGITGLLCAGIVAAILSTHATYMHSWGSIFIQDVVLVMSARKLTPASHLRLLRLSILGVALFTVFFGLLFQQNQQIFMFFAITGAIFLGGSGAVIIGGLYWSRGTTAAAFSAMIVGSLLAVLGIAIDQMWGNIVHILEYMGHTWPFLHKFDFIAHPWPKFPINGQWMYLIAMVSAIVIYIIVSLCGNTRFDMDKLLHRGKYAVHEDEVQHYEVSRIMKILGMGKEFSFADRCIYISILAWCLGWWAIFLAGVYYNMVHDVSDLPWARFWHVFVIINMVISTVTTIWMSVGGIRDLSRMFANLRNISRDCTDDGVTKSDSNLKTEMVHDTSI